MRGKGYLRSDLAHGDEPEATKAALSGFRWFDLAETIHSEPQSIISTGGGCTLPRAASRERPARRCPDPDGILRPLLAAYEEAYRASEGSPSLENTVVNYSFWREPEGRPSWVSVGKPFKHRAASSWKARHK